MGAIVDRQEAQRDNKLLSRLAEIRKMASMI